jgi:hypothetical protein
MESVAPVESNESEESVSSVMPTVPPEAGTELFEDDEANKLSAIRELKDLLPKLEAQSEDARRCLAVIIENFHAANRLLLAAEKTGVMDLAVLEFRYSAVEIGNHVERIFDMAQQVEIATNEVVKGAKGLAAPRKTG